MRRSLARALALAALLPFAACAQDAAEEGAFEEAAPAVDVAAIEADVQALRDEWERAALAGDAAAVAALYAEDGILMPPGMPRAVGRGEIESSLDGLFGELGLTSVSIDTDEVFASGDLALAVATYRIEGTGADSAPWQDTGKSLIGLRSTAEGWRIVADAWSSDATPPAAGEGSMPGSGEPEPAGEATGG